jgi:hypothetical protein
MQQPKTLKEAIKLLPTLLPKSDLTIFENMQEEELYKFHHGLGRWLRNQWGLWSGSDLQKEFIRLGINHADDMSSIIIILTHRKLNNKEAKLEILVEHYKHYWEANA